MSVLTAVSRLRRRIAAWTIRIVWPAALIWGCFDLYELMARTLPPEALSRKQDDAAIRFGVGLLLFVIWLFFVRTRGPWTLNRDGNLER